MIDSSIYNPISYGIGAYDLYYSSQNINNPIRSKIMDRDRSTYATWGYSLYNSSGLYIGSNFIVNGYTGEWMAVSFPTPIVLLGIEFMAITGAVDRAPGEWKVYGSNDGLTFFEIVQASRILKRQVA